MTNKNDNGTSEKMERREGGQGETRVIPIPVSVVSVPQHFKLLDIQELMIPAGALNLVDHISRNTEFVTIYARGSVAFTLGVGSVHPLMTIPSRANGALFEVALKMPFRFNPFQITVDQTVKLTLIAFAGYSPDSVALGGLI